MKAINNIPTRSELLERLRAHDDAAAWSEFCTTYGQLIHRLARSAGLTPTESDDVVQEVFIALNRNISSFQYDRSRCSFKHWLTNLVRWRIHDQRARRPTPNHENADPSPDPGHSGPPPELAVDSELESIWDSEWRRNQLETVSRRVRNLVKPKQFQIFYLHVLQEMPVAEVSRRLHVSTAQVYLAKLRVGILYRKILKSVQAAEMEPAT